MITAAEIERLLILASAPGFIVSPRASVPSPSSLVPGPCFSLFSQPFNVTLRYGESPLPMRKHLYRVIRIHRTSSDPQAAFGPQAAFESTFSEGVYAYAIRPNILSRRL